MEGARLLFGDPIVVALLCDARVSSLPVHASFNGLLVQYFRDFLDLGAVASFRICHAMRLTRILWMRSRDRRHAQGGHRYSGRVELASEEGFHGEAN